MRSQGTMALASGTARSRRPSTAAIALLAATLTASAGAVHQAGGQAAPPGGSPVAPPAGEPPPPGRGMPGGLEGAGTRTDPGGEPVYQPPLRGMPRGRIGAGTRGGSDPGAAPEARESFMLVALAPDDAGWTIAEQPAIYWFASTWTGQELEFSLSEATADRPVVERRLPPPPEPGIQRVDLADLGVRLSSGKRYQWFVALITDPGARSRDIVAGAAIERVSMPAGIAPHQRRDPVALARAGLWYDAFDALSRLAASHPGEPRLRLHRASLLEQVGLREVARWERERAR